MELRHLRYFLAVAEHLNFGRAAAALHTAQPALSQQIRKLEHELGGPLFERTKRYVALTGLGRNLLVEAQAIVEAADGLAIRMRDTSGEPRGRLRVGSIMPATIGVLPRILPSYRERFPLVELSVATVGLDEQVRALIERRIDVGILRGPVTDERIHTARMAVEYFCINLPKDHALAQRGRITMRDLTTTTMILLQPDQGGSFNDEISAVLQQNRAVPKAVLEAPDVPSAFALVASGVGVNMSSTIFCGVSFPNVIYRPLTPRTEVTTLMLACRRDRQQVPVVRSFFQHVAGLNLVFAPPA
ncbi:LysR substrate-binding domain-containing protein [Roseiarcaceae bacterium H3SJ34-1]|uniref:LysR family transcriptional regulator n=1 Tax=Terripilifer ovatus TaxID=3032367 RepID=UPI003AB98CA2|nr:LysR substrate-binding domain-containing protein [Roseiarcaceae bacterium H3SJ34-1]